MLFTYKQHAHVACFHQRNIASGSRIHGKRDDFSCGARGKQGRRSEGTFEEDVYNIDTGWNENAFSVAAELLSQLEGWEVQPGVEKAPANPTKSQEFGATGDGEVYETTEKDGMDYEEIDDSSFWAPDMETLRSELDQESHDLGQNAFEQGTAERDLLDAIPRHVLKDLIKSQEEAYQEREQMDSGRRRREAANRKTHKRLRIISGSAAKVRLVSPQGDQTRPMMEKVRGAVFSMISSLYGSVHGIPCETRWLDLFAGTGAVGIEALSRGCGEGHFVELSEWVVDNCLHPNLEACQLADRAVVHTMKAEDYLKRASQSLVQPFDFISLCPPYELVSYPELYELLEGSALIGDHSIVLVEYPQRVSEHIKDRLGPLVKVKERKYGRTWLALYALLNEP
eukprot:jgi/Picsp_1/2396/NSC_05857-R1_protein